MNKLSIVLVASLASLASVASLPACSKKDGAASAAKAAEGKAAPVKLAKLGLQLDLPGDVANLGDAIGGDGVMIQAESIGAMQVEVMKTPRSLDDEKSDADMYKPKNLKTETLADGWALTFDNTGSMGANYFVTVRRDLGGKSYECTTTASSAEQAKAVLAACKSLRVGG